MVLQEIIKQIKAVKVADDSFDLIGGSIDYATAERLVSKKRMAFVLPLNDDTSAPTDDAAPIQKITETFAVLCNILNQKSQKDKTGMLAYNEVHTIRKNLFKALYGYQIKTDISDYGEDNTESLVYYAGGNIVSYDAANLWYQFTFSYKKGITNYFNEDKPGNNDGVDIDLSTLEDFPDSQTHTDIEKT